MYRGYILLSRNLIDSDVFASQKLLKIWIWCLLKANHKSKAVTHSRGNSEQIVNVERGQFLFGRHKANEELGINESTIYKCLKKLEKLRMISIKSSKRFSIITIDKYRDYQDPENYRVTTDDTQSNNRVTTDDTQSNTNNNDNNYKHDKEYEERERTREEKSSKDFIEQQVEIIYNAYPKKSDQIAAKVEIQRAIYREMEKQKTGNTKAPCKFLLERVKLYAKSKQGKSPRFCKKAKNWFADGNYNDDPSCWEIDYNDNLEDNHGKTQKRMGKTPEELGSFFAPLDPPVKLTPEEKEERRRKAISEIENMRGNNGKNNIRNRKIKDREKFAPEKTGGFFNSGN